MSTPGCRHVAELLAIVGAAAAFVVVLAVIEPLIPDRVVDRPRRRDTAVLCGLVLLIGLLLAAGSVAVKPF